MALILDLKVVPLSRVSKITIDKKGKLTIYITTAPEKGKANKEVIKILSKALKIPQNQIQIISGSLSRNKRIKIETLLTLDEVFHKLGIELQTKIT